MLSKAKKSFYINKNKTFFHKFLRNFIFLNSNSYFKTYFDSLFNRPEMTPNCHSRKIVGNERRHGKNSARKS